MEVVIMEEIVIESPTLHRKIGVTWDEVQEQPKITFNAIIDDLLKNPRFKELFESQARGNPNKIKAGDIELLQSAHEDERVGDNKALLGQIFRESPRAKNRSSLDRDKGYTEGKPYLQYLIDLVVDGVSHDEDGHPTAIMSTEFDGASLFELSNSPKQSEYEIAVGQKRVKEEAQQLAYENRLKEEEEAERQWREDQELRTEARTIIKAGKTLEFFRKVYATLHAGDLHVLEAILMQFAAGSILNTKGIHIHVSGPRGKGKSSSIECALHLLPLEYWLDVDLSRTAIFNLDDESKKPGMIVYLDDTQFTLESEGDVKRSTTKFQAGRKRKITTSVSGGFKLDNQSTPPRMSYITSSVGDPGDEQIRDRFYILYVNPTPEQTDARDDFLLSQMEMGEDDLPVTHDVEICRMIGTLIREQTFYGHVSEARKKITLERGLDSRYINQFRDIMYSGAVLNYENRLLSPRVGSSALTIDVDLEDFDISCTMTSRTKAGREYGFTGDEQRLADWIMTQGDAMDPRIGTSESYILTHYKVDGKTLPASTMRQYLYGREGSRFGTAGNCIGGICGKASITSEVIQTHDDEYVRKKGTRYFYFYTLGMQTLDRFAPIATLKDGVRENWKPLLLNK